MQSSHRGPRCNTAPSRCLYILLVCFASTSAFGQGSPELQLHQHHELAAKADQDLRGNSVVINVKHRCENPSNGDVCSITITKDEFDALVNAIDRNMPVSSRQSLAEEYTRVLIMAAEARSRGVDKTPEVQTLVMFSTLQVLSTRLVRQITGHPHVITDDELQQYFEKHRRDYTEVVMSRIFVPLKPPHSNHPDLSAAARAALARRRILDGEDFSTVQYESSATTLERSVPNIRIGPILCSALSEPHRDVCDLRPGEISPVLSDTLGYVIYKIESLTIREIDQVRDQIRSILERDHINHEIERVRTPISLQLEERYFGKVPDISIHGLHSRSTNMASQPNGAPAHQH
jgi:hypothetical protein